MAENEPVKTETAQTDQILEKVENNGESLALPETPELALPENPIPASVEENFAPGSQATPNTFHRFEDYLWLDWTKRDAELASQTGVSRQRIGQVRRKLREKERGNPNFLAEFRSNAKSPPASFPDFTRITEQQSASEVVATFQATAEMTFDMATGALTTAFGQEWKPRNEDERQAVVSAIARYYQAKGIQDLPPGWMLVAVVSAYSLPRLGTPNTKSKIQAIWTYTRSKVARLFSLFRKHKQPKPANN